VIREIFLNELILHFLTHIHDNEIETRISIKHHKKWDDTIRSLFVPPHPSNLNLATSMPLVPCLTVAAGLALPVAATAYHLDRRRDETAAEMVSCLMDNEVENEPGCGDGDRRQCSCLLDHEVENEPAVSNPRLGVVLGGDQSSRSLSPHSDPAGSPAVQP
jgi:hypothetical protein